MTISWPWAEEKWQSITPIYGVIGVLSAAGLLLIVLVALIITCCLYCNAKSRAKKIKRRTSSRTNIDIPSNVMSPSEHRDNVEMIRPLTGPPPIYPGPPPIRSVDSGF